MAFTFQQGSTVILTDGTTNRELLVGSVSASQTYLEEARSVKTIHNPNNVQDTFTNSKSPVTLEFSCHLTKYDDMLLEWFGFVKSDGKFLILPAGTLLPILDVYIKSFGTTYKVEAAYATSMSIRMDKTAPLSVSISATGSNLITVSSIPNLPSSRQNNFDFIHGSITVAGYSSVGGVTCEITKDISWTNDKTIHAIMSGVYLNTKATCQDLAIGGSITNYKRDDSLGFTPVGVIDIEYEGIFKLYFDKCKTLDRWDLSSEVHKKITDYKLLPVASESYIQYINTTPPAFLEFIIDEDGFLIADGYVYSNGEVHNGNN